MRPFARPSADVGKRSSVAPEIELDPKTLESAQTLTPSDAITHRDAISNARVVAAEDAGRVCDADPQSPLDGPSRVNDARTWLRERGRSAGKK